MKQKLRLVLLALFLSMVVISCSSAVVKEPIDDAIKEGLIKEEAGEPTLSVWNVYWDHEHIEKEIQLLQDHIHEICYFAAYFDSSNHLFIPEAVTNNFERVKEKFDHAHEYTHYLTIVNDKINLDGSSTLKDTKLLYSLFLDEAKLESHINEIITMAKEGGFDGIEIDYEQMKEDKKLWALFADYCELLYERLSSYDLKMRVILEPSLPAMDFPLGPDYIMMCYNLYGLGTGPGPKADQDFIIGLVEKIKHLPGKKGFAFATGGFDWAENGEVTALTEQEARERISAYGARPIRDESSQGLYYYYIDSDQMTHQVWFADGVTLSFWRETVRGMGDYSFSLWRLNGNDGDSLKQFVNKVEG